MAADNEWNFISRKVSAIDKDLFFGPLVDDEFIEIEGHEIMANLVAKAGCFPSASQARKNGWNKPIPSGFSEFFVGKLKRHITILNLTEKE